VAYVKENRGVGSCCVFIHPFVDARHPAPDLCDSASPQVFCCFQRFRGIKNVEDASGLGENTASNSKNFHSYPIAVFISGSNISSSSKTTYNDNKIFRLLVLKLPCSTILATPATFIFKHGKEVIGND